MHQNLTDQLAALVEQETSLSRQTQTTEVLRRRAELLHEISNVMAQLEQDRIMTALPDSVL